MISFPARVSRFPVGSSARRMAGLVISALPMATRCCWPPESCEAEEGMPERDSARPAEILRTEHLRKVYGTGNNEIIAVNDAGISVAQGEFVAIVGSSGWRNFPGRSAETIFFAPPASSLPRDPGRLSGRRPRSPPR